MTLNESQLSVLYATSAAFSALSVAGSSFIIVCYFAFPQLRKFAFRLVCILSFNDFFNQMSDFISPSANDLERMAETGRPSPLCLTQAWFDSFFELSSVMWTTAIAATLYMSVILRWPAESIQSHFWVMCLVCWGIPALLTIIPGAIGAYGVAGGWCWITDEYDYFRFIQFFVPLLLAITFNSVVYIRVSRLISNTLSAAARTSGRPDPGALAMQAVVRKLQFYPLILIVVWTFGIVNRVTQLITGEEIFWLFLLQKMFSSLQGFLNAFAYGFSAGVREALRQALSPYLPCIAATDRHDKKLLAARGSRAAPTKGDLEAELDTDMGYGGGALEADSEEEYESASGSSRSDLRSEARSSVANPLGSLGGAGLSPATASPALDPRAARVAGMSPPPGADV